MTALLILAIAAALAFGYFKYINTLDGQELMGCGIFMLIPPVILALLTILALIFWT